MPLDHPQSEGPGPPTEGIPPPREKPRAIKLCCKAPTPRRSSYRRYPPPREKPRAIKLCCKAPTPHIMAANYGCVSLMGQHHPQPHP